MKIDFFTFLTSFSAGYAEFLKYSCEKNLSKEYEIDWKCIESVNCERLPRGYKCVAKADDLGQGGMNHGAALTKAIDYIEHDYVIFIDSDVAIVYPGWDKVIVDELNNYDCFGGGYKQESGKVARYKNFPNVNLFTFRSYILDKVKLDFYPYKYIDIENKKRVYTFALNEKEAMLCGLNIGDHLKCDAGWKLPLIIKGAGFTGNSMPEIYMKSKHSKLPYLNEEQKNLCLKCGTHMSEWHYKDRLFATHRCAGRKRPIDSKYSKMWKERVELYMGKWL